MRRLLVLVLVLGLGLAGCAPLTFSNEGSLDFERYRSCLVERVEGADGAYATEYLTRELRALSGFAVVTTNPREPVDLRLVVSVTIREELRVDDDGDLDVNYEATATFTAREPGGAVVATGVVEEESEWYSEALEDALDEIAHYYLLPYRA